MTNVGQEFLNVATSIDKDRGTVEDINGLYKCDGYGVRLFLYFELQFN